MGLLNLNQNSYISQPLPISSAPELSPSVPPFFHPKWEFYKAQIDEIWKQQIHRPILLASEKIKNVVNLYYKLHGHHNANDDMTYQHIKKIKEIHRVRISDIFTKISRSEIHMRTHRHDISAHVVY